MDCVAVLLEVVGAREKPSKRHFGHVVKDLGWVYHTDAAPVYKVYPRPKHLLLLQELNDLLSLLLSLQRVPRKAIQSICGKIIHAGGGTHMQPSLADIFTLLKHAESLHVDNMKVKGRALRGLVAWRDYLESWDGVVFLYNTLFLDVHGSRGRGIKRIGQ